MLVAYYIPNRGCSSSGQGAPSSRHYRRWIDRLIDQLGSTRAAIVVEPDAVAADCFDTRRAILLKHSVTAAAGQYVYLDAGHARWRSTGEMAERLLSAGIQYAQGFSVNVANRQTTRQSHRWGRELSDLPRPARVRGRHLRNGLGPPPDEPDRDDEWCNPRRQALGQPPPPGRPLPRLAALLWIKLPANRTASAEARPTILSPTQAQRLILNSPTVPAADRQLAAAVDVAPTTDRRTERDRRAACRRRRPPPGDKPR